jgi:hypothetical protein
MSSSSRADLIEAVERERKRANVRSLDISFNELADMYETSELQITPEYQRTFRWSSEKQSQFIESIILEMPVPPIYAVEVGEARWELIDGLQRLSTYLHFRGKLNLPDRGILPGKNQLILEGCDIIPELNGQKFEDLPTALQHRVRRATLRVEVVRQETNPHFAFYMFKRLNTGGEPLSDMEARNCSIRLLGPEFCKFLADLAQVAEFQTCIEDITEEFSNRMGKEELVLRFFAFKNNLDEYVHDIDPFLTRYMERVTDSKSPLHLPFDYELERECFAKTFENLSKTLGPKACQRWVDDRFSGGFTMSHFEAFSIGLADALASKGFPEMTAERLESMKVAMTEVKKDADFKKLTVGGARTLDGNTNARLAW